MPKPTKTTTLALTPAQVRYLRELVSADIERMADDEAEFGGADAKALALAQQVAALLG